MAGVPRKKNKQSSCERFPLKPTREIMGNLTLKAPPSGFREGIRHSLSTGWGGSQERRPSKPSSEHDLKDTGPEIALKYPSGDGDGGASSATPVMSHAGTEPQASERTHHRFCPRSVASKTFQVRDMLKGEMNLQKARETSKVPFIAGKASQNPDRRVRNLIRDLAGRAHRPLSASGANFGHSETVLAVCWCQATGQPLMPKG